jgi:hypothetical protein
MQHVSAHQTCHLQGVFVVIITLAKYPLQQRSTCPCDTAYTTIKLLETTHINKKSKYIFVSCCQVFDSSEYWIIYDGVHMPSCVGLTVKRKSNGTQKICHTATRDNLSYPSLFSVNTIVRATSV